jgi:polyisoprenoid-binding protein YceI
MLMQPKNWIATTALTAFLTIPVAAASAAPGNWTIDRPHTEINFSVNHFFTPVTGTFRDFKVSLEYDAEHPERSQVEVSIDVASVDTGNRKRDNHLKTADWFDAAANPKITFRSKRVRRDGPGRLIATGDLAMRGTTRTVDLPITLLGSKEIPAKMQPMLGGAKTVASFASDLSIDRGDYGVGTGSWAATMVVGGEVKIKILAEAHQH